MSESLRTIRLADREVDSHGYRRDPFLAELPASGEIVVYDTEFTTWEGSAQRDWSEHWESREVFQLGAVRLAMMGGLPEVAHFNMLVQPVRNPVLSDYAVALTGVSNEQLRLQARPVSEAAAAFCGFCEGACCVASNGWDGAVLREALVHAGLDQDDGSLLPFDRMTDLRPFLCTALGIDVGEAVSADLWRHIGERAPSGPAHDGLADARGVAAAVRWVYANRRTTLLDDTTVRRFTY